MLSSIIQGGTKTLGGSRFSLVNLLPTTFFVTFMIALITSGAYSRPEPDLNMILDKFDKDPWPSVAATLGVFLVAVLLRPFQVTIVQMLEGYWQGWRPLELANEMATERHRRIHDTASIVSSLRQASQSPVATLGDAVDDARRSYTFQRMLMKASATLDRYPLMTSSDPADDRLMPTVLGNVLRNDEDNAGQRYGLDMPAVYPRMYPFLSPKLDKAISTQLDILDTMCALCVAFGLSAIFSSPLIIHMDWWSLVPIVAILMSFFAYRGAIAAARGHGILLATAFDLHRFDMLQALHYKLPLTPHDELELNERLSEFLGAPHGADVLYMRRFRYKHPPAAAGGAGTGKP